MAESIDWGDGKGNGTASFDPTGAHSATFSHNYTATGLYRIVASAADARGATVSRDAACLMAVYDAAGSAKGSGSFDSPAGAYKLAASVGGKATFGECAASWQDWLSVCSAACVACCGLLCDPSTACISQHNYLHCACSNSCQVREGRLQAHWHGQVHPPKWWAMSFWITALGWLSNRQLALRRVSSQPTMHG